MPAPGTCVPSSTTGNPAAVVIGPERLPRFAQQAARLTARVRQWAGEARSRVKEEMGGDIEWQQLDPRQYDPRRIVRQALLGDVSLSRVADSTPPPIKTDRPSPLAPDGSLLGAPEGHESGDPAREHRPPADGVAAPH